MLHCNIKYVITSIKVITVLFSAIAANFLQKMKIIPIVK